MEEFSNISGELEINGTQVSSSVSLKKSSLVFKTEKESIIVPLLGIIESNIFPSHLGMMVSSEIGLPTYPYVFLLTYLQDVFDRKSFQSLSFTSPRSPLEDFVKNVQRKSSLLQNNLLFHPPIPSQNQAMGNSVRSRGPFILEGKSKIIDEEIEYFRVALPTAYQKSNWKLLYSSANQGRRIGAIFSSTKKLSPLILLIKTTDDEKFGAYLPEGINESKQFYGGYHTFVFQIDEYVKIFKTSNKNTFFVSTTSKEFIIGGTSFDGTSVQGSSIYFNSSIDSGYTHQCSTFDSPPLANQSSFLIGVIEIWHIVSKF